MTISLQIILEDVEADNPLLLSSRVKRGICILQLQIARFARNDKDKGNRREANASTTHKGSPWAPASLSILSPAWHAGTAWR